MSKFRASNAYDDLPPVPVIGARLGATAPTLRTFTGDIEQYTFDATAVGFHVQQDSTGSLSRYVK